MRLKVKLGWYSYHNNETFIIKGIFMCAVRVYINLHTCESLSLHHAFCSHLISTPTNAHT